MPLKQYIKNRFQHRKLDYNVIAKTMKITEHTTIFKTITVIDLCIKPHKVIR